MATRPSILITGASTGIGRACALRFDQLGWSVYAGVRKEADAQQLRQAASSQLTPVILDVTDEASLASALRQIQSSCSAGLAALVNNAGMALGGPLELMPMDRVRSLFDVNVFGTFAVTRACLPLLRQGHGRIVNISSISGLFAAPGLTAYSASKFAVEGFTDALRVELAPFGVKVIAVEPGKIDTPIWDKARQDHDAIDQAQPENIKALYAPLVNFFQRFAQQERATPMAEVVAVVEQAVLHAAPKPRYVIGRSAKARTWVNRLPYGVRDGLILRAIAASNRKSS